MHLTDEFKLPPKWTQSFGEELANTISHLLGLVAAMIGIPFLLFVAWKRGDSAFFIGSLIFAMAVFICTSDRRFITCGRRREANTFCK